MKFLFWALVLVLVYWAWRRSQTRADAPSKPSAPKRPTEMVRCAQCGTHVPHEEAVQGERGLYCSTGHRQAAGDRNPA